MSALIAGKIRRLAVLVLVIAAMAGTTATSPSRASSTKFDGAQAVQKLPLSFVENRGQFHDAIRYVAQGDGYAVALTPAATVLSLAHSRPDMPRAEIRMRLVGANDEASIESGTRLPGKSLKEQRRPSF